MLEVDWPGVIYGGLVHIIMAYNLLWLGQWVTDISSRIEPGTLLGFGYKWLYWSERVKSLVKEWMQWIVDSIFRYLLMNNNIIYPAIIILNILECSLTVQSLLQVPHEVLELLAVSSNNYIEELLSTLDNTDPEFGRRTTRKITTLAKFKSSLDSLMKTLSVCDLHYVRCIKPSVRGLTGKWGYLSPTFPSIPVCICRTFSYYVRCFLFQFLALENNHNFWLKEMKSSKNVICWNIIPYLQTHFR